MLKIESQSAPKIVWLNMVWGGLFLATVFIPTVTSEAEPTDRPGGDTLSDAHHHAPINGTCGSANGVAVNSAPTSGLCSAGTASSVSGSGPWDWSCAGSN